MSGILETTAFRRVFFCVCAASFLALAGCGKMPSDVLAPEGAAPSSTRVYPNATTDPRP